MKSLTSALVETLVSDTTAVRYFTLVDRVDLLAQLMGGRVRVPSEVFDPLEDTNSPDDFLSEVGLTERHWARTREPEAGTNWSRFRALRQRSDLEVVDLDLHELSAFAEMTARRYLRRFGKSGRLGKGEAAVIALAENRGWVPIMDDRVGRAVLNARVPGSSFFTTDDMLRRAALRGLISSREAEEVYQEMRRLNYRGPQRLWQPDG